MIKLLSIGGVLIIHDSWLRSVEKTARWMESNLRFLRLLGPPARGGGRGLRAPSTKRLLIAVKTGVDRRAWDHFEAFRRARS